MCSRCGAEKETINHALFECPPSTQTWALSNIPSNPRIFPVQSIFTNFDYLFWRISKEALETDVFPWILWYIWKARNDKLYNNIDRDPLDILKIADVEAKAWELAQLEPEKEPIIVNQHNDWVWPEADYRCYIDGSWKDTDQFTGLGWYCTHKSEEGCIMGARNVRRSLTPLHAEVEALLWALTCLVVQEGRSVAIATDCSELVKMIFSPWEWPAFTTHLEEIGKLKESLSSFTIIQVKRSSNVKADNLAKSARIQPHDVLHVDATPPVWISKPF